MTCSGQFGLAAASIYSMCACDRKFGLFVLIKIAFLSNRIEHLLKRNDSGEVNAREQIATASGTRWGQPDLTRKFINSLSRVTRTEIGALPVVSQVDPMYPIGTPCSDPLLSMHVAPPHNQPVSLLKGVPAAGRALLPVGAGAPLREVPRSREFTKVCVILKEALCIVPMKIKLP